MGLTTEILRRIWVGRRSTVSSNSDLPGAPQGHRNLETGFPSPTRRRPAPWPSQPQLGPEIRPVNGRPLGRSAVYRQLLPHQCGRATLWMSSNKGTVLHPESTAAAKPDGTSANRPDSPGGSNGVADRPSKASRDASARALASHRVRLFALPPLRPWGCHRQDSSEGIDAPNIMSLIGSWPVSAQIDAETTGQTQHVTDGEFALEWGDQAAVLSVCGNRDPANQPGGD